MYDIQKNEVRPFLLDPNYAWKQPAFSPDGRYLAVVKSSDGPSKDPRKGSWIVLLDLQSKTPTFRVLSQNDVDQSYPAFSPDGEWIAYAQSDYSVGRNGYLIPKNEIVIKRMHLKSGKVETVYRAPEEGWVSDVRFISNNEIWVYPSLLKEAGFDYLYYKGDDIIHLTIGQGRSLPSEHPDSAWYAKQDSAMQGVRPSLNRTYLIKSSKRNNPFFYGWTYPKDGYWLFAIKNGEYKQLIQERTIFGKFDISQDGTKALILNEEGEKDYWLIDIPTGEITKTNLVQKMTKTVKDMIKEAGND